MSREESEDCFRVCENYARCFDMACETANLAEGLLLENIMDAADRRRRECGAGQCAILAAARATAEHNRKTRTKVAEAALRIYEELLDKDQLKVTDTQAVSANNG